MTTSLIACLAFLVSFASTDASIDAKKATDELFRSIPREVAAVAVMEDLDGFLARLEQSELVKRVRRSKLFSSAVESEIARRWKELDGLMQSQIGAGLDALRKDVFGLSVMLAYWPKNGGEKDEAGLLLVRARSAERLEELLQSLFRLQGAEPPKRTHDGVAYWTSRDGERRQFLLTLGPIGLLTDDEDAVQRVIQASKNGKSWGSDSTVAEMRRSTPGGALVSFFVLTRNLDAKLPGASSARPAEAEIRESVVAIWKSVGWVSFTAHLESELKIGLHASVASAKLPKKLNHQSPAGTNPIPTQGLNGTVASMAAGAEFSEIVELAGRLAAAGNPKDAAVGGRFVRSLFMGADKAAELASLIGPRFGIAMLENAGSVPEGLIAIELRPMKNSSAGVSSDNLVEQALRFAALVLTFEANKNGDDRWELRMEEVSGARVHVATGGRKVPKGIEPCFTVHQGWIMAASSPNVLRRALTETKQAVSPEEFARLDLQAARRAVAKSPLVRDLNAAKGIELLETLAEVVPQILFKSRTEGEVHHWTMELPSPK
jgi:hypothetical protein